MHTDSAVYGNWRMSHVALTLPKLIKKLKKPIVFEEFGIARDGGTFEIESSVTWRNKFYSHFFNKAVNSMIKGNPVQGINFWTCFRTGFPLWPREY